MARNDDTPTNLQTVTIEIYSKRRPKRSEPIIDLLFESVRRHARWHRYHSRRGSFLQKLFARTKNHASTENIKFTFETVRTYIGIANQFFARESATASWLTFPFEKNV